MPKLFNLAPLRIASGGGITAKRATPSFLRGSAPAVQAPSIDARVRPIPLQLPAEAPVNEYLSPWHEIDKGVIDFLTLYHRQSIKIADEKDRVNASRAARTYDDALRNIMRGDHDEEKGYLYLDGYEALDRKSEYDQKINQAFEDITAGLNPNAKRYAAERMLGYRRSALREVSEYHLQALRKAQADEQAAQLESLYSRMDDYGGNIGKAMSELAAFVQSQPEADRGKIMRKILIGYTDLISAKDPRVAVPLLEELEEKAGPVLDLDSRYNLETRMRQAANNLVRAQEARLALESQQIAKVRHANETQMFADMTTKKGGPDLNYYRSEVINGRMERGAFNTMKKQWENREHLPPIQAAEEYAIKRAYLDNQLTVEDIMALDRQQSDKDRLLDFAVDIEADERSEEIKYYHNYISSVLKSRTIHPMFGKQTDVLARNAQEAFRQVIRDPKNKKSLFENANDILSMYGVEFTELDKLPSIVVPGGAAHRPISSEDLIKAVEDLKRADELGTLTPEQKQAQIELVKHYQRMLRAEYYRQKSMELKGIKKPETKNESEE